MAEEIEKSGNSIKTTVTRKRRSGSDLSSFVFGKIPPQARDLEEAILGALLLEKDPLSIVVDILKPETFYVEAHQHIFRAILSLFEKNEPVDILTVTEELRKRGELELAGGAFYITELTNRVASSANVEFHARIVSQKFIQRKLIEISSQIIQDAYEDTTDVFDLLNKAEKGIYDITDQNLRRSFSPVNLIVTKAIKQLDAIRQQGDSITGVPSGFTEIDNLTNGWQKSDLIIIAARPSMGKTSFVLSLARNAAIDHKRPVALFSLEMASVQLAHRLISAEAELPADKLRRGSLELHEWEQLSSRIDKLSDAPIFIDDTPAINIFELRAKCRRMKMQHNIQMVIIDYLQLMSGVSENRNSNREQEISNISRALKTIAKELEIPVIALSQLNRSVETRGGDKRPQLSDLRESGAIEQDADMVMFIYRPEYYGFNEDSEGNSTQGIAEIIIAKNRNGAQAIIPVRFINRFTKFISLPPGEYNKSLSQGETYKALPKSDNENKGEGNIIIRSSRMKEMDDQDMPF